jgi:iron complex transport system substrate-binding protein
MRTNKGLFIAAFELLLAGGIMLTSSCREERHASDACPDSASHSIPQRIVCGAPATTEIIFALGCAERVVGVSDVSVFPAEATEKPSIGGWTNPNHERLLMLRPDIIVTQGQHASLAAFAREFGIRFLTMELDTLDDIYNGIGTIADALGVVENGTALQQQVHHELDAVRSTLSGASPRPVAMLFGRSAGHMSGLATVGPNTFLNELLAIAGGTNVFADAKGAYPQISKESLLVRNPEVMLEAFPGGITPATERQLRADWEKQLPGIAAVKHDNVHYLVDDYLLMPGPRVALTARRLAEIIHPERFRE